LLDIIVFLIFPAQRRDLAVFADGLTLESTSRPLDDVVVDDQPSLFLDAFYEAFLNDQTVADVALETDPDIPTNEAEEKEEKTIFRGTTERPRHNPPVKRQPIPLFGRMGSEFVSLFLPHRRRSRTRQKCHHTSIPTSSFPSRFRRSYPNGRNIASLPRGRFSVHPVFCSDYITLRSNYLPFDMFSRFAPIADRNAHKFISLLRCLYIDPSHHFIDDSHIPRRCQAPPPHLYPSGGW
jgi:hypothetical protein